MRRSPSDVSTVDSEPLAATARASILQAEGLGEREHRPAPENFAGGAGRDDAPRIEHDRDLPDEHGFVGIVGDVEDGDLQLVPQAQQVGKHACAQREIECGERLVHEQGARAGGQCARHRDALALSARDLIHAPVEQAPDLEDLDRAPQRARRVGAGARGAETHVLVHREVREERRILGDPAEAALLRGHAEATLRILEPRAGEARAGARPGQ